MSLSRLFAPLLQVVRFGDNTPQGARIDRWITEPGRYVVQFYIIRKLRFQYESKRKELLRKHERLQAEIGRIKNSTRKVHGLARLKRLSKT